MGKALSFLCVCVCVLVYVYMCGVMHLWRLQTDTGVFVDHSPPLFLIKGILLKLELVYSARLVGYQILKIFLPLLPQHCDYRHVLTH